MALDGQQAVLRCDLDVGDPDARELDRHQVGVLPLAIAQKGLTKRSWLCAAAPTDKVVQMTWENGQLWLGTPDPSDATSTGKIASSTRRM